MILIIIVIFILLFFSIHTITNLVIGLYTAFNLSTDLLHDFLNALHVNTIEFLMMIKRCKNDKSRFVNIQLFTGNHPSVGNIFELQGISVCGLLCVWSVLYNQD